MTQAISRWTPSSTVTTHTGQPVPSDWIFFTAPPLEIGEVYTAYSGWQGSKRAGRGAGSIFAIVIAAIVGAVVGCFLLLGFSRGSPIAGSMGALLGAAVCGYLTFRSRAKKNSVTYTGARGIAKYVYADEMDKRERGEIFLFADAVDLRTAQTRKYTNFIYTGTDYDFNWTGSDGRLVYWLGGNTYDATDLPKNDDPYHYGLAAEIAWSKYLLKSVKEELSRSGTFQFNLIGNDYVVAGPGYLELCMGSQQVRCMTDEIAKLEINKGVVTVRRKDAEDGFLGIGSTGTFKFTYSELANGRVFIMLLDQLVGIY